jgi:hypothetical protein
MTEPMIIAGRIASGDTYDRGSGKFRTLRIDPSSHGMVVLDYEHHETHGGSSYVAFVSQITASSDDNMTAITVTTPNTTKWLHMFAHAGTSGVSWFRIYRGVTIGANAGTSLATAWNRNENSTKTSGIIETKSNPDTTGSAIYWDETDAAGANLTLGTTIIHEELIGAGKASFAQTRGLGEIILKQNTNYAFVLENEGAAANKHSIILDWYEHTDKN